MRNRTLICCILLMCCMLTSGCWDRRELQERGFVVAVAIDLAEEGKQGGSELESFTASAGTPKPLRLSVQVLKLTPSGGETGPKNEGKTFVVSNTGRSMHEMIRDMLGQTSKGLYFEHIQSILISEAVVKSYNLRQIIDFWRRDAEMRWRTKLFIVTGEAREVLEFQPPTGEAGGVYLANMADQNTRDPHIGSRTDLGFTSMSLDNKGDVVLPRLEYKEKQVKINGLAIFRKDKFIGYWDEYTVKGMRLARGNIKSGTFSVACPEHPGHAIVFELFRHNTILNPHVEGDRIYFTLKVAMRGNISEVTCQQYHDTFDSAYLEKAETMFAEEITRNISHTLNLSKREEIDTMALKKNLKAYEPKTWAQIEDRWDEIYPDIPMVIDVRVSIQNVGEHK